MQQSQFGIVLALIGALILTPDSLLMRLSQMDGGAMLAWRATLAGMVFLLIGLNKRFHSIDTSKLIFPKALLRWSCVKSQTQAFSHSRYRSPLLRSFWWLWRPSDYFRDP